MFKKMFLSIVAVLFIISTQAQDRQRSIKPFRLGVKVGIPNIIGGNAELVFLKRIGLYADYSTYTGTFSGVDVSFNHFEIGGNIYFHPTGKGFYGSFSYSSFSLNGTYTNAQTIGGVNFTDTATGGLTINTFNTKLGLKLGRTFYFRTEIGYGFGTIPDTIEIMGIAAGVTQTGVENIPKIPGISSSGLFIFNIGFGIGF